MPSAMNLDNAMVPSSDVGKSLKWLVGVFLMCLVLVFGLRGHFTNLESDIQQRGTNERARLFIGDEIVRGIQGVEKDIYRMAVTQNANEYGRIKASVNSRLDKLNHDLQVLKSGGTTKRLVRLNTYEQEELTREASYKPSEGEDHLVLELIEIGPQIDKVRERSAALESLLSMRWSGLDQSNKASFFTAEENIALLLKQMASEFERLNENANRLFLEGDQRLRALEAELQTRTHNLKQIETGLIVLVVVLGGLAGILYTRRLTYALNQARLATHNIERQREQNATILNTLSDGVYTTDMKGDITFVNASAEKILGWQASDLVGKPSHEAIHHTRPDGSFFPQSTCPLIAVLQKGATLDSEEHFVSSDGSFVPVAYRSKPLTQDGQAIGSLVSFHDITERLQSQARIRLQQAALDAAANMIVITNQHGVIEFVNPAFCQTTGYTADEVIGAHSKILNSGVHDDHFYKSMWLDLLKGLSWEGEIHNKRKNGEIYPEQMTITPIMENGAPTHFVAIKRDITQEIQTRTRLKMVESAIQEIEQGIVITKATSSDLGPIVEYVNAGYCRMTGFCFDDVVGTHAGIMQSPNVNAHNQALIKTQMAKGESLMIEMDMARKDGSLLMVELHLSPVHNDKGQASHYIGLLTDISLRKEAEAALRDARDQALENSRLKSEFLSTMSHEIRTPMNGIIGMTDLLLDTPMDAEQRDFTSIVRDSAQSLLVIINDILDFSKIEAGKLEVEITDYSPLQVVEGTVELLLAKAREKSLWLTSFVDPSLPQTLLGDPTRLRQILLNLIGNAIKFTEHGGVELSVQPVVVDDVAMIRFDITDTGIGITPSTQSRLFSSFTQADSSTTRKYGGTGLGLAICKRLVVLMGGDIGITSTLGQGSNFWFTLPLTSSVHNTTPHLGHLPEPLATNPQAKPLHVLVVDDQAIDRKVLGRYLDSWGMVNHCTPNAYEALKQLIQAHTDGQPYDFALVDLVMPGMDGLELARAIRADQRLDALQLILLTGHDRRDLHAQAKEAGFLICLSKPVRQSQLYESLLGVELTQPVTDRPQLAPTHLTPNLDNSLENRPLVLLAEDNLINQKVAQLQINKLGYAIQIVNNGQEALDAVAASHTSGHPFAAILMDCQMPVMDGFEATAAIRVAHPSGSAPVPIIAMTANAMQGDRERCLVAGMDDYISKPIVQEELQRVLLQWTSVTLGQDVTAPALNTETTAASSASDDDHQLLTGDDPLINFELLSDYFGDDPDTITRLLDLFESTTTVLMDKVHAAITQRDGAAVCSLAHELKGSCGNIGINRMARMAGALEVAAEETLWPRVDALGKHLQEAFQATLAARTDR